MCRDDLMQHRRIITVEELEFSAKLAAYLDRHEAAWQAKNIRRGRPATMQERQDFDMWRYMVEEEEWERFCGV
jgi:hypothetical protein